jgi:alkylated DNA repair dioxygenase AlkB
MPEGALDFASALLEARAVARKEKAAFRAGNDAMGTSDAPVTSEVVMAPLQCPGPLSCLQYQPDVITPQEASMLVSQLLALPGWRMLPQRRLLSLGGTPHPSGAWTEPLPPFLAALAMRMAPCFHGHVPDQVLVNEYCDGQGIDAHNDGPLFESEVCILSLESSALLEFVHPVETTLEGSALNNPSPRPPLVSRAAPGAMADPAAVGLVRADKAAVVVAASVLLQPRSVVVFSGPAYAQVQHRIQGRMRDPIDVLCVNAVPSSGTCEGGGGSAFVTAAARAGVQVGLSVRRAPRRISITFRRIKHVTRRLRDTTDLALLYSEDRAEIRRRADWWARSVAESVKDHNDHPAASSASGLGYRSGRTAAPTGDAVAVAAAAI